MRHHVAQQGVGHVGAGAAHRIFQRGRMQGQQVARGVGICPHPLQGVAARFDMPIGQRLSGRRIQRQAAVIRGAQDACRRDDLADGAYPPKPVLQTTRWSSTMAIDRPGTLCLPTSYGRRASRYPRTAA
ncbi:hypothetical protein G6F22_018880 [Rhizopus arrhizus]|nr:hypothetical protein G6F22_018880 [Rhizopus arrhizus]